MSKQVRGERSRQREEETHRLQVQSGGARVSTLITELGALMVQDQMEQSGDRNSIGINNTHTSAQHNHCTNTHTHIHIPIYEIFSCEYRYDHF